VLGPFVIAELNVKISLRVDFSVIELFIAVSVHVFFHFLGRNVEVATECVNIIIVTITKRLVIFSIVTVVR
jgi:hypothetical protein